MKRTTNIKDHAYYQVRTPGIIRNDTSDLMTTDTVPFIFIEAKEKAPSWSAAWVGNDFYTVRPIEIKKWPHPVGWNLITGEKIELSPSKAHQLFFLELKKNPSHPEPPVVLKHGEILLKGIFNGQLVYHTIRQSIQLASPRFQ